MDYNIIGVKNLSRRPEGPRGPHSETVTTETPSHRGHSHVRTTPSTVDGSLAEPGHATRSVGRGSTEGVSGSETVCRTRTDERTGEGGKGRTAGRPGRVRSGQDSPGTRDGRTSSPSTGPCHSSCSRPQRMSREDQDLQCHLRELLTESKILNEGI